MKRSTREAAPHSSPDFNVGWGLAVEGPDLREVGREAAVVTRSYLAAQRKGSVAPVVGAVDRERDALQHVEARTPEADVSLLGGRAGPLAVVRLHRYACERRERALLKRGIPGHPRLVDAGDQWLVATPEVHGGQRAHETRLDRVAEGGCSVRTPDGSRRDRDVDQRPRGCPVGERVR